MRLARLVLAALLAELGRLVAGGVLQLYSSDPPARVGEVPQTAMLLVEMRIESAQFADDDLSLSLKVANAVGRATGQPQWFQVREAGGSVAFDGNVGPTGDGVLKVGVDISRDGLVQTQTFVIGWGI